MLFAKVLQLAHQLSHSSWIVHRAVLAVIVEPDVHSFNEENLALSVLRSAQQTFNEFGQRQLSIAARWSVEVEPTRIEIHPLACALESFLASFQRNVAERLRTR